MKKLAKILIFLLLIWGAYKFGCLMGQLRAEVKMDYSLINQIDDGKSETYSKYMLKNCLIEKRMLENTTGTLDY